MRRSEAAQVIGINVRTGKRWRDGQEQGGTTDQRGGAARSWWQRLPPLRAVWAKQPYPHRRPAGDACDPRDGLPAPLRPGPR
ncbi:hypothetical protein [Streptomyces sp. DT9]